MQVTAVLAKIEMLCIIPYRLELINDLQPTDYIKITVSNPAIPYPIDLPFARVSEYSTDLLFEKITDALNSSDSISMHQPTTFSVVKTKMERPNDSGPSSEK